MVGESTKSSHVLLPGSQKEGVQNVAHAVATKDVILLLVTGLHKTPV